MDTLETVTALSEKDTSDIHPHNDDPMAISVKCETWEIKRVLVDQGSSINILYWDAFERPHLDPEDPNPFRGSLSDFHENMCK